MVECSQVNIELKLKMNIEKATKCIVTIQGDAISEVRDVVSDIRNR